MNDCYIHPQATVMGMVKMGVSCSIWPGAVLRADMQKITLGDYVNIQDNSTIHADSKHSVEIGDYTLVGHNTMLHGCKIGKGCLIGIGSIILDGAEIGDGAAITAGCMIRGGKKIPPMALVVQKGNELRIIEKKARPHLTIAGSLEYVELSKRIKENIFLTFTKTEEEEFIKRAKLIVKELQLVVDF